MNSLCLTIAVCVLVARVSCVRYEPNWDSLDTRPLPPWYDDVKLGIFLHWGVFSVPSFSTEWFWEQWLGPNPMSSVVEFMKKNYPPDFTYADFAPMFRAEFFDPKQWVDIIKAAGAKYVVLTTKHCEGFTLWPSKHSWPWNAMQMGPRRDLVGELSTAVRAANLHFGVYHCMYEWFNPLYLRDAANGYRTQEFVATKAMPELYELVNNYKPDIVWSDGEWMVDDTYWNSTNFLAWLYNDSPVKETVCVNDRWGNNTWCQHGDFLDCQDKYNPNTLQKKKWEDNMSVDRISWGYRRTAKIADLYTIAELVALLAKTVSLGGNLLINVGPTSYGVIAPEYEERLRGLGEWLEKNGEAIYHSRIWIHQTDPITPDIWYTSRNFSSGEVVYAISLQWYGGSTLVLGGARPGSNTTVTLLGTSQPLPFSASEQGGMEVQVPNLPLDQVSTPGHAWVFRLDFLQNRRK